MINLQKGAVLTRKLNVEFINNNKKHYELQNAEILRAGIIISGPVGLLKIGYLVYFLLRFKCDPSITKQYLAKTKQNLNTFTFCAPGMDKHK